MREVRLDDASWVRRAQAGERYAYDELVRRHQRAALRVAAAIVGSSGAADAAQEAFLRAHRGLAQFDSNRPFRPWLLGIVANTAKNEVRSAARHRRLEIRARERRPIVMVPTDPLVREEEQSELLDALARLSAEDRLVLALRWFEEMSEAEMANSLDVRTGTVKSRLHRAMTRLRNELSRAERAND